MTLDGTIVGIPTLEATDPQNNNGGAAQGIGFVVPSARDPIAHRIIATGRVAHTGRAYLGVAATDQSQAGWASGPGGSVQATSIAGPVVQLVAPRSPSARAGIQPGDVITAANGAAISGEADLLAALAHAAPGSTMTLTLNRNGKVLTVQVRLGELSASR